MYTYILSIYYTKHIKNIHTDLCKHIMNLNDSLQNEQLKHILFFTVHHTTCYCEVIIMIFNFLY